jgi:anti-sigma factor RsiW
MNCGDARDLLYAYADNELDALTSRNLEAHLSGCAKCQSAFEADRAVKSAVGISSLRRPAPDFLRKDLVEKGALPEARSASRPTIRLWPMMNLAASLLLVGGLAWLYSNIATHPGMPSGDAGEVLAAHLRSMQLDSHLVDVQSTDQHTVKPWFDGKLDFAPPVRDFKDQGYALLGGRLDYLHNRPVAALVYRRYKHLINVFIWPEESPDSREQLNGYNLSHFSKDGMTYWLISDVNDADLASFAALLRNGPPATTP